MKKYGFTLIELMIVVAIIGILAAIGIPKFSLLITRSHESSTKGGLGALRSALSIYYADNEGQYPIDDLTSLGSSTRWIVTIPFADIPAVPDLNVGHPETAAVTTAVAPDDNGGWLYDNVSTDQLWGTIVVDCTHSDSRGNVWTSY